MISKISQATHFFISKISAIYLCLSILWELMDRLMVVWFILNIFSFTTVYADYQGDALTVLRNSLHDPTDVFNSWDNTLVNPCTWYHVTCDANNGVIRIDLGNSQLSGTLVAELGNLKTLQYLELNNNTISGSIPRELGKLSNLVSLDLYGNQLTGPIPEELGNLASLRFLRLNDNNLSGRIPVHALAKIIPNLEVVDISNNPGLCSDFTDPPCPK